MDTGGGKRRVWPAEERQRIVAEAMAPNASVAAVALHHGVNANLLFKGIRRSRQGWLDRRHAPPVAMERVVTGPTPAFVPVEIVEAPAA
jgi:transposase